MIGQVITFDGHRLNDLFYTGDVAIGLPSFEHEVADMRYGATWRSTRLSTCELSVTLVAKPSHGRRPREAVSALLSWLDVDGPRWLTLSGDDGLRRLAVPTGAPTYEGDEAVTVTFLQLDPYLYGEVRSVTMPYGTSSVSFVVDGDAPTWPTIECAGARAPYNNGYVWVLERADDGTRMGIQLAEIDPTETVHVTYETAAVTIDCAERTATLDGNVPTTITLATDWLSLTPGTHTIREVSGDHTQPVTISWTERWHR